MPEATDASTICTNYLMVAHINSVAYSIYGLSNSNPEHDLLEVELLIRQKYPRCLITYYNKKIFYYMFGHEDNYVPITKEHPSLHLIYSQRVPVDKLASCQMTATSKEQSNDLNSDPDLMNASLGFIKAVKKMALYNLSKSELVRLFGNHAVTREAKFSNRIVYIDVVLEPNGDLLLSLAKRPLVNLYDSTLLGVDVIEPNNINFVLYLIPMGVRCHLYDREKIESNFTTKPPKSQESILRLIKLVTGVEMKVGNLLWVKLKPDFKHLNNQMLNIAKYTDETDNKKFILWPWNLCLLQFGYREREEDQIRESTCDDPLSLISEFIDLNMNHYNNSINNNTLVGHPHNESLFSADSIALASGGPPTDIKPDSNDLGSNYTTDDYKTPGSVKENNELYDKKTESKKEDIGFGIDEGMGNDIGMDDLFGGTSADDEDPRIEGSDVDNEAKRSEKADSMDVDASVGMQSFSSQSERDTKKPEQNSAQVSGYPQENFLVDIPREKMTIPSFSDLKKEAPSEYEDPGAPGPFIQTPSVILRDSSKTIPNKSSISLEIPINLDRETKDQDEKSVYSPIPFNPMIKDNIDSKYFRGGKFFVEKDQSLISPDKRRDSIRATSVSGTHPLMTSSFPRNSFSTKSATSFMENTGDIMGFDEKAISSSDKEAESDADDEENYTSDVDQDFIGKGSPLITNTENYLLVNQQLQHDEKGKLEEYPSPNLNTGSTTFKQITPSPKRTSSSVVLNSFSGHVGNIASPLDNEDQTSQNYQEPKASKTTQLNDYESGNEQNLNNILPESSSDVLDSTNVLPFILRSVNVNTIPLTFFVRNSKIKELANTADLDVESSVYDAVDYQIEKEGVLITSLDRLDELLRCLEANIIFDTGLGINFYSTVEESTPSVLETLQNGTCEETMPDENLLSFVSDIFPLSFRMTLSDLCSNAGPSKDGASGVDEEYEKQMSFLESIAQDNIFPPGTKMSELEWDSLNLGLEKNKENFNNFTSAKKLENKSSLNCDPLNYFCTQKNKLRLLKGKEILHLNKLALNFWYYLNFCPLNGKKNFQILLISEENSENYGMDYNMEFLDSLVSRYNEGNFGTLSKVNLSITDSRADLASITNGLLLYRLNTGKYDGSYSEINKKLKSLAELIKLDLINKSNKFEFDRPLLLLFINFDESFNSLLLISKLVHHFKTYLSDNKLPLVEVFSYVLPWSSVVKKVGQQKRLRYLSNYKFTKIASILYNLCPKKYPNGTILESSFGQLHSLLDKEPPRKLRFVSSNINGNNDTAFNDDIFLHFAYDRSLDKKWCSAAWSDTLGNVTHTKSWYCSSIPRNADAGVHDIAGVVEEMWNISVSLIKGLNDLNAKTSATLSGKKFLVLSRVNSVIPDEELIHWKKLSARNKDISLIVLATTKFPRLLFKTYSNEETMKAEGESKKNDSDRVSGEDGQSDSEIQNVNSDTTPGQTKLQNEPNLNVSNVSTNASISNSDMNMELDQQTNSFPDKLFLQDALDSPILTEELTPEKADAVSQVRDEDSLCDPFDSILAVIPERPLFPFCSPGRFGAKMGFLLKECQCAYGDEVKRYWVFEINLLSCSEYWNSHSLMSILLKQFRNLIDLGEIIGLRGILDYRCSRKTANHGSSDFKKSSACAHGLMPWHIAAVSKMLDYLVHIEVEE